METFKMIFVGIGMGIIIIALIYPYYSIPDISHELSNIKDELHDLNRYVYKDNKKNPISCSGCKFLYENNDGSVSCSSPLEKYCLASEDRFAKR